MVLGRDWEEFFCCGGGTEGCLNFFSLFSRRVTRLRKCKHYWAARENFW